MRLPQRFAESNTSAKHLGRVEEQINKFLAENVHNNLLNPNAGVNLQLTNLEAEILFSANDRVKEFAKSGEMANLHNKVDDLYTKIESFMVTIPDSLDRVRAGIVEKEQAGDYKYGRAKQDLQYAFVKLQEGFYKHVSNDFVSESELNHAKSIHMEMNAFKKQDGTAFDSDIKQINDQLNECLGVMSEYEKANAEKQRWYHSMMDDSNNEGMDAFKAELLKYLAATIIVPDSRLRYQQEQFTRWSTSLKNRDLFQPKQSLKEFSRKYAEFIDELIVESNYGFSPKIEANYDDWQETQSRPINSTIFYYFFSLNRTSRSFGAWMLSAAKYPNERTRRAYMRFFA